MKKIILILLLCLFPIAVSAQEGLDEYKLGVEDIIEISVLQPDEISRIVAVAPDGTVSFPYIGTVNVKGKTIHEVKEIITQKFSDGFMKYPVVLVSLQESRSRTYFVYGEVTTPGSYKLEETTTVLTAISMAGGFSKFGSSSRVKILRRKQEGAGYETLKINIGEVMSGDSKEDIPLKAGDMVVVSEGIF